MATRWSLPKIKTRRDKAKASWERTGRIPRALSIGATRIWGVGEVLTAANMVTFVTDVLSDLAGRNGPIEIEGALVFKGFTTLERSALTAQNGMTIYNTTTHATESYENGAWTSVPTGLVHDTGAQSIGGLKTFTTLPRVPIANPTNDAQITSRKFVNDENAKDVHLTGAQTVAGRKTFSTVPRASADPVASTDLVRKGFFDANAVSLSGAQTFGGVKTFGMYPLLPATDPTNDRHPVSKGFLEERFSSDSRFTIDTVAPTQSDGENDDFWFTVN